MKARNDCPECGRGTLAKKLTELTGSRKGESFEIRMAALVCPKCNFKTVQREDASDFALRTANAYRAKHGLLTSMEIRDLRAQMKMTQQQFADFLKVGVASVKRWELGEIQDAAMDKLMRLSVANVLRGHPRRYCAWGGFEQLSDKMAIIKYEQHGGQIGPRGFNSRPRLAPILPELSIQIIPS